MTSISVEPTSAIPGVIPGVMPAVTTGRLPAPRPAVNRSTPASGAAGRSRCLGPTPAVVSAAQLLTRCDEGLRSAERLPDPAERFCAAHLAAIRAAAAVLAVRGRPRRGRVLNVWELLPRVAPELSEWAAFYLSTGSRRAAIEAGVGTALVSTREADDLCRQSRLFAGLVAELLGLLAMEPEPSGEA